MAIIRAEGDERIAAAAKLPLGKVFESGSLFAPLVANATAARLIELGEAAGTLSRPQKPVSAAATAYTGDEGAGGAAAGGGEATTHVPHSHAEIIVGSLVLCSESGDDGYWPAIVIELKPADEPLADEFVVTFRDFEGYAKQVRRRADLGLMPRIER